MKYYKDNQNIVFAYDETQMELVGDKTSMSDEEVELHINPVPTKQELTDQKVVEAKQYLDSTDHKMYIDYEPKVGEDLDAIKVERKTAREFIRANQ